MKKYFLFMLAVFPILFSMGCSAEIQENRSLKENQVTQNSRYEEEEDKIIIGATLASEDSSYLQSVSKYMYEAAKEKDIELNLVYADWDSEIQAEQMSAFVKEKVDAIILCPINAKSMLTSLKMAKEAGIPVINLNMKVDSISSEYIDTYVGASMSEEGAMAAELLIEALGEDGGEVAIIEGAPGSDAQIYRTQTFIEKLTPYPNIKVVAMGNGDWTRVKSYLVARDIILKNPEISAIFSQDSNMAMGAIMAIEELDKEDEILVIGIGEDEEYLEAIKEGKLYGLITQPPDYEGKYSIYCAVMAANGEELRPWYKDPVEIITLENIKN